MPPPQDNQTRNCPICNYNLAGLPTNTPCPECGESPACVGCNYDLAGLPLGCTCPECGKVSPDPNAHNADTLDKFCFCTTCSYHLYTLKKTDNCPECGQPASDSTIVQSIYRSGATYLDTLRKGFQDITLGLAIFVIGIAFMFGGAPLVSLLGRAATSGGANATVFGSIMIVQIALLAAFVAGAFFLLFGSIRATTKDPHLGKHAISEGARSFTRAMAFTNFFLYLPGMFCIPMLAFAAGETGALFVMTLYFAAAVALILASTVYTQRIVARIGTKKLINICTKCSATLQILIVLTVIFSLPLAVSVYGSPSEILIAIAGIGFTATSLVGFLVYAFMLAATSRELKRALKRGMTIPTAATLKDAAPIATDPPAKPDSNP